MNGAAGEWLPGRIGEHISDLSGRANLFLSGRANHTFVQAGQIKFYPARTQVLFI